MRASSATRFLVGRASQSHVSGWTSTWSNRRPTRSPFFQTSMREALCSHTSASRRPSIAGVQWSIGAPTTSWAPSSTHSLRRAAIPLASSFRDAPGLSGTRGAGCLYCLRRLSIEFSGWRLLEGSQVIRQTSSVLAEIIRVAPSLHKAGTFSGQVLEAIHRYASKQSISHSVETGSGASTLLFSHLSDDHTVFALDDGTDSIRAVRTSPLFRPERVTFVEGPTQLTIPTYRFEHKLQLVLIDGPHGYPFPDLRVLLPVPASRSRCAVHPRRHPYPDNQQSVRLSLR